MTIMPKKTVKTRLEELEAKRDQHDKPVIVVIQSYDGDNLFYFQNAPQDIMTEEAALQKLGDDYDSIWIRYVKNWRKDE